MLPSADKVGTSIAVISDLKENSMNCWEFKKCGRKKGGAKTQELGICPFYPEYGKSGARVARTLRGGKVQGTFATKPVNCMQCDFSKSGNYKQT